MIEADQFTPPPFIGLARPPSFILLRRPARPFAEELLAAGLSSFSTDEVRAQALADLAILWPAKVRREATRRLRRLWRAIDAGREVQPADTAGLADLERRLVEISPPFAEMLRVNRAFQQSALDVAVGMLLVDWRNLPFSPRALGDQGRHRLVAMIREHVEGLGHLGRLGWAELAAVCSHRISAPASDHLLSTLSTAGAASCANSTLH